MTREEIETSWPIRVYFTTLKRASYDQANDKYMTESSLEVINFDKVPNEFSRGNHWPSVPKSNDALYIDSPLWTFIEFKNARDGNVDKVDIYRKIYDSIIMLLELGIVPDMDFVRKHIVYILVCRAKKSENLAVIHKHAQSRAKSETILFDLRNLKDYLLAEVHTYSPEEFEEKFVRLHEGT